MYFGEYMSDKKKNASFFNSLAELFAGRQWIHQAPRKALNPAPHSANLIENYASSHKALLEHYKFDIEPNTQIVSHLKKLQKIKGEYNALQKKETDIVVSFDDKSDQLTTLETQITALETQIIEEFENSKIELTYFGRLSKEPFDLFYQDYAKMILVLIEEIEGPFPALLAEYKRLQDELKSTHTRMDELRTLYGGGDLGKEHFDRVDSDFYTDLREIEKKIGEVRAVLVERCEFLNRNLSHPDCLAQERLITLNLIPYLPQFLQECFDAKLVAQANMVAKMDIDGAYDFPEKLQLENMNFKTYMSDSKEFKKLVQQDVLSHLPIDFQKTMTSSEKQTEQLVAQNQFYTSDQTNASFNKYMLGMVMDKNAFYRWMGNRAYVNEWANYKTGLGTIKINQDLLFADMEAPYNETTMRLFPELVYAKEIQNIAEATYPTYLNPDHQTQLVSQYYEGIIDFVNEYKDQVKQPGFFTKPVLYLQKNLTGLSSEERFSRFLGTIDPEDAVIKKLFFNMFNGSSSDYLVEQSFFEAANNSEAFRRRFNSNLSMGLKYLNEQFIDFNNTTSADGSYFKVGGKNMINALPYWVRQYQFIVADLEFWNQFATGGNLIEGQINAENYLGNMIDDLMKTATDPAEIERIKRDLPEIASQKVEELKVKLEKTEAKIFELKGKLRNELFLDQEKSSLSKTLYELLEPEIKAKFDIHQSIVHQTDQIQRRQSHFLDYQTAPERVVIKFIENDLSSLKGVDQDHVNLFYEQAQRGLQQHEGAYNSRIVQRIFSNPYSDTPQSLGAKTKLKFVSAKFGGMLLDMEPLFTTYYENHREMVEGKLGYQAAQDMDAKLTMGYWTNQALESMSGVASEAYAAAGDWASHAGEALTEYLAPALHEQLYAPAENEYSQNNMHDFYYGAGYYDTFEDY